PHHEQGRRKAGVPRGEGQVSRNQNRQRGGEDDEIASGQQEAARGRTATCRGHRSARTGHKTGGYYRSGVGSSSGPCSVSGSTSQPSSSAARRTRSSRRRRRTCTATSRATISHPPPAITQLPSVYRRRTACCHSCSNRPTARPVVARTAASKSSPDSSRSSNGVSVPVGF